MLKFLFVPFTPPKVFSQRVYPLKTCKAAQKGRDQLPNTSFSGVVNKWHLGKTGQKQQRSKRTHQPLRVTIEAKHVCLIWPWLQLSGLFDAENTVHLRCFHGLVIWMSSESCKFSRKPNLLYKEIAPDANWILNTRMSRWKRILPRQFAGGFPPKSPDLVWLPQKIIKHIKLCCHFLLHQGNLS